MTESQPLNPHKTILVCKVQGREVGRIRATAENAEAYLIDLAIRYREMQVDYESDPTDGLLAVLHGGQR